MEQLTKALVAFVIFFAVLALVAAIVALPTMLLINAIFSTSFLITVFGGPIGFWSALGLNLLCSLLFKPSSSKATK